MIIRKKNRMRGTPSINDRRISVFNLVSGLDDFHSLEYLNDFDISTSDALDALHYCINLKCKEGGNEFAFCEQCVLGKTKEDHDYYFEFEQLNDSSIGYYKTKDGAIIGSGSKDDFDEEKFGIKGWEMANKVLPKFLEETQK